MTSSQFLAWLEGYRQAWETRDPEAAAALFVGDATYYETPFGPPAQGKDGIRKYWAAATGSQRDVSFSYEILSISDARGVARWWAEFTRIPSGVKARLDGIFLLEFDANGLCRSLREWWHKSEARQEIR